MRLCFIASGVSIHTKRWVNYFAQKGHEVHLISYEFPAGYEGYDSIVQSHSLIRLLPQIWKISGYISGILWLLQVRILVKKIKPDILHAHFIEVPAYLSAVTNYHPLVLSAWGSDVLIIPKNNHIRSLLAKYAIRKADHIICVSPTLKEEVVKLGAAPEKVEVIPNGVETQKFRPSLRSDTLLRELGIAGSPVVISTRNLKTVYDVETLIRAIPLVLHQVPESKFIISGEGEQRIYLENLAQSLGVTGSVIFTGMISHNEVPRYLASSDVYVSTSLSDGTSVSLLEALACELAPVVSDIPANQPWVNEGESGFLFNTGDYKTLASRISLLLKDSEIRTRFGQIGRDKVMEKAEYTNEMLKVEEIYQELRSVKQ